MTRVSLRGMQLGIPTKRSGANLLPFADDFNRADGDLGNGWLYSAGVWTINSNAVTATPAVGSELMVNGNMETGDPPSSWTAQNGSTLSGAADERTGGVGVQSLNVVRGTADAAARQLRTGLGNRFLLATAYLKNIDASWVWVTVGSARLAVTSTAWTQVKGSDAPGTLLNYEIGVAGSAGKQGRFDDYSLRQLTTADLFAVRDVQTPNARVTVTVTEPQSCACGVVVCLDDQATPSNFIVAFITRDYAASYITVRKSVNGTYSTVVASIAITYSAGATLALEHSNTTVRVFYNNVQVGIDYVISDASIISNTLHGMFNTDPQNNIASCEIVAAPPQMLGGSPLNHFTQVTAASNLFTSSAPLDWLGWVGMADLGTHWIAGYQQREQHQVAGTGFGWRMRFSDDEGATWSDVGTFIDDGAVTGIPEGVGTQYFIVAPNGDVLFLADDEVNTFPYAHLVYRSSDGGKTWVSAASGIPDAHLRIQAGYGCVVDGVIYVPMHKFASQPNNVAPWDQEVWISSDNGMSWSIRGSVPWVGVSGDEFSIIDTGGTNMIAVCRDYSNAATYINTSSDMGATWSQPTAVPDIGVVQMGRIKHFAGGLMMFGRERSKTAGVVYTTVWYSTDGGVTWCRKFRADTTAYSDAGYCDVLERSDGKYYIMTYGGNVGAANIRDAVFEIQATS